MFQTIFEQFELVTYFGRLGQTTVDQSLWIVYETLIRLVQVVFYGHNNVNLKGDFGQSIDASRMEP